MQRGYFFVVLVSAGLTGCASSVASGGGAQPAGDALGLSASIHYAPTIMSDDFSDYSGSGMGLSVGYGFTPRTSVFVGVDVASMTNDEDAFGDEQSSDLTHWDLGVRYAFDAPGRRFVPYVSAALSQRLTSSEFCDGFGCSTAETGGTGFSTGLGLHFFPVESLAVDAGWLLSFGTFSEGTVNGETVTFDEELSVSTGRFMIGASWYPSRSGGGDTGGGRQGPLK